MPDSKESRSFSQNLDLHALVGAGSSNGGEIISSLSSVDDLEPSPISTESSSAVLAALLRCSRRRVVGEVPILAVVGWNGPGDGIIRLILPPRGHSAACRGEMK